MARGTHRRANRPSTSTTSAPGPRRHRKNDQPKASFNAALLATVLSIGAAGLATPSTSAPLPGEEEKRQDAALPAGNAGAAQLMERVELLRRANADADVKASTAAPRLAQFSNWCNANCPQ